MSELRPRILKHGDTFGLFDHHGDILPGSGEAQGVYHRDTRYLSGLQLLIAGRHPLLLSSKLLLNNTALAVDLTNPDIEEDDTVLVPRDVVHIARTRFMWQARLYERVAIRNFGVDSLALDLDIAFAADFADIFEARGFERSERGVTRAAVESEQSAIIRYSSLDGMQRSTALHFNPAPDHLSETEARYRILISPGGVKSLFVTVRCQDDASAGAQDPGFFHALKHARRPVRNVAARSAAIDTSNNIANEVVCRSMADLTMLLTDTEAGAYPYAGVPWFSTPFGRDGIITALMMLWCDPAIARGVLRYLASTQAETLDPESDAEPGKILHETRDGELARLRAVPFRRYYGTVDATPLFVLLAGAYYDRTGDIETIRALDPHIQRALAWIEAYGDRDGDGFVEYGRQSGEGLVNQGWKDSFDSVFHASGALAQGPIALIEVQGYAYAAFRAAAKLAAVLGRPDETLRRDGQAEALRAAVEAQFWSESLGFYALALDGEKQKCRVRTSNAGQLLFTGLPDPVRASRVAKALFRPDFFTGFGVRTVAATEARYNPMSYHNGSVWPHDNGLIALGLAQYGFKDLTLKLLGGLFDAAAFMDLRRLPELFCGFRRLPATGPTLYPVACSPQAWASATPFALLQAALGLSFKPDENTISFDRPSLPKDLARLHIHNLRLGDGSVDVLLRRAGSDVAVNVLDRTGDVKIIVTQ